MGKSVGPQTVTVTLADTEYHLRAGQLYDVSGQPIPLRAKSARMLEVLLDNQGSILSKNALADSVWSDTAATDESISRCISDIRKVLLDDSHSILETFPKKGYRINATITSALPPTSIGDQSKPRRYFPALISVGFIALVAFSIFHWYRLPPSELNSNPTLPKTIAVLPFEHIDSGQEENYLTRALAEDLILELSDLSGFKVAPRAVSFALQENTENHSEVAQILASRYLVYGRVEHSNNTFRISTSLVDGSNGATVWNGDYHGNRDVLLTYHEDTSKQISKELAVTLNERDRNRLNFSDTQNVEAFDEVLQGRRAVSSFTYERNLDSERHFRKAIELDPNYALAYAELAASIAIRLENDWAVLSHADNEKAFFYAHEAIRLDSELWLAHYALGRLYSVSSNKDLTIAEKYLRRAMTLQPANDDARVFYAAVKIFQGDQLEAIPLLEAAITTHPSPPFWYYLGYGHALFQANRYADAEEPLLKCLEQLPTAPYCHRFQIANYAQLDQLDDAEWATEEYAALGYDATVSGIMSVIQSQDPSNRDRVESSLRKAGLPE